MSRVLVTGVSGFIGRHLVPRLKELDITVRGTSRDPAVAGHQAIDEWFPADLVNNHIDLEALCSGCRWVIHLAGQAHAPDAPAELYEEANHRVTRRLARAAAAAGVRRFVYVSSAKVHGEGQRNGREPAYTETDAVNPGDAYACSKWAAEQAVNEACAEAPMECTIVRPPLVYGPAVKANFLRLMQAVRRGTPLPLAGIRNRRSLLYVENLCDLLVRVLEAPESSRRTYLAADTTLSTPELVQHLAEGLAVRARLLPCPPGVLEAGAALIGRRGQIARLTGSFEVDTSALRRELGWRPPVDPEEGLYRTARWFLDQERR